MLRDLAIVTEERDILLESNENYIAQLRETQNTVNSILTTVEGTRLQGLLANQHSEDPLPLTANATTTLIADHHAISIDCDERTASGVITLQGNTERALPRVICVFLDEEQNPLRKITIDFGDQRIDQGFVSLRYDTGLNIDPAFVRLSMIDPVIDQIVQPSLASK